MEKLKPNDKRATTAITLIWIILGLEIVMLISGYFQHELLMTIQNGGEVSEEATSANDDREMLIAVVYLIVNIISVVTFIQWFRRAYYNLHLKVKTLSHTEGWAAGAWFVPVICLFRPYQIMQELYKKTQKYLSKKGVAIHTNFSTAYLGVWWALWIIANLIGHIAFRLSMSAATIDEFVSSSRISMVGNVVGIPLALLAIKVIQDYSKVEPLLSQIKEEAPNIAEDNAATTEGDEIV
ncbi:DUF4328 domain-containing protein [Cytophaga aurantiaca]|uniref:DUF4328 domain-containing protein n=1 Tax=Cytophaga aurantiaca TaxID=29530 RepID=UPI00037F6AE0|nr:DUF4328 domain-containing protein [Cytophaga aurantiaca]